MNIGPLLLHSDPLRVVTEFIQGVSTTLDPLVQTPDRREEAPYLPSPKPWTLLSEPPIAGRRLLAFLTEEGRGGCERVILGVLDQLRVLDTMGVQKGELTKPDRCVFRVWGFGFGVDVRLWKGELADKARQVRF